MAKGRANPVKAVVPKAAKGKVRAKERGPAAAVKERVAAQGLVQEAVPAQVPVAARVLALALAAGPGLAPEVVNW